MIGKIAYGVLFAAILPAAMVMWAMRLDRLLALPQIGSPAIGVSLAIAGAFLVLGGVIALRRYGAGWPMSPYPPQRRVSRGAYAIFDHPIYAGSVLLAAGLSIALRSAAGLWIVTPVLALCCIAFVIGYEHEATIARFGPSQPRPLLHLRLSIYFLVLLPWLLAFQAVNALGVPDGIRSAWSVLDRWIPLLPWTEPIYFFDYLFVLGVPLLARTRRELRDFAVNGWIAIVGVTLFYLAVPIIVPPRPAPLNSIFTPWMLWERGFDTPITAFPAFHVIWAAIAAAAYTQAIPRLKWLWWTLAVAISISCLTTGMHAIADVVAAAIASALILSSRRIARLALDLSERLANSWREWDFGFIRAMSHGLYAAAGSFLGFLIVDWLTGATMDACIVGLCIILGAALWAQFIEGSPHLLRPFGYFGGVIGCCIGIAFTRDPWLMLAAYAVAAPVIQAFGRCRCLVQGCCHGRPTSEEIGIRYRHPRSRVTRLSELAMQPLHATQLYSIAWNAILFVILLRLWTVGASLQFIAGTYFILSGIERFVEEHFRGEPQTPIIGGLRSYQWLSILSVLVGAILTCARPAHPPAPTPIDMVTIAAAALFALITYIAYGVDFPRLNVRFARLV
ncbi:MAG TPA: prolipoprotein diacylglyceryl transferase family protein [Thermoanaerobaculia bacterium]